MSFQWNVQPYALLSEMRAQYTQVLMSGTSRMINQLAPEIESWMKQNAPWQDRTGAARGSLQARVVQETGMVENPEYQRELEIATQKDIEELAKINLQRRKAITWGGRQPLSNIPKEQSHVSAFQAAFSHLEMIAAKPALIGSIRLGYGDDSVNLKKQGIAYVLWLEVANQGRYGIISRALAYWGAKLHSRLRQVVHLVQFEEVGLTLGDVVTPEQQFQQHIAKMERFGRAGSYKPFDPAVRKRYTARKKRARQLNREETRTGTRTRKTRSDKGRRRT